MLEDVDLSELESTVRGHVLRPGGQDYELARRVFNAMIDRRPAAIVRCAIADDVIAAVNCARSHDVPLSVKGGGHSVAGAAVCDGGIMVDLSLMKGVRVDPDRQLAVAQPGLTLGEFDSASQAFGLATTDGCRLDDGDRRLDARWGDRLAERTLRPCLRQPHRGGRGDG